APGLENQHAVEIARRVLDDLGVGVRIGRRLVVVAIRNAEAAAQIDVVDAMAIGAQHAHELREQREGILERLQFGYLAADMHVDARDANARELAGAGVGLARAADWDAELVLR